MTIVTMAQLCASPLPVGPRDGAVRLELRLAISDCTRISAVPGTSDAEEGGAAAHEVLAAADVVPVAPAPAAVVDSSSSSCGREEFETDVVLIESIEVSCQSEWKMCSRGSN